jgi:hypothetical protein
MKKWFQKIGLGLFGFIILALVLIFIRSTMTGRVDETGLKLERANIPPGANAYDVLQAATNHFWWPDNQSQRFSDLADDTNWDGNLAAMVLATNREALAAWDAAVKLPNLQVPEVSTFDDLLPYLSYWKKLALLARVRENALFHNGQEQEAFDQIVSQIQIGRRMENSHGGLIVYLVGIAVESLGLNQLQHWTGKIHLSPSQLEGCIRQIEPEPGAEAAALANAIKIEYQVQISTLDAMRRGQFTNSETGGDFPSHGWVWPLFDFRQTQSLFAKGALTLVEAAPRNYKDVDLSELESHPGTASMLLSGNPIGEIFYYMLMPSLANSLERKSRIDVQVRATQTILALRAYQLTHGKLPENLDALVPEFLDKVPVDAFNGLPLRYSPDRKIVYSVGQNLKDDGGNDSRPGPSNRPLDFVYKFDFGN